jgi:hypothetical protein
LVGLLKSVLLCLLLLRLFAPAMQVTAALVALQVTPGAAGPNSQQQQQQPAPILDVPQLGPELQKLLQQPPGSNAQELYGLWQQGVPLQALGSMHSGNMTVSIGWNYQVPALVVFSRHFNATHVAVLPFSSGQVISNLDGGPSRLLLTYQVPCSTLGHTNNLCAPM